jgi:hypothetical protein
MELLLLYMVPLATVKNFGVAVNGTSFYTGYVTSCK